MRLLVLNGPNLNLLGIRQPEIYGHTSYTDLVNLLNDWSKKHKVSLDVFQSNHEGELVDKIQAAYQKIDGIIINPAAYTHTSIAIRDALAAVAIPFVEVHLSAISQRENYRHISYVQDLAIKTIEGQGLAGYLQALDFIKNYLDDSDDPSPST
ncbi:type II 3-dehydroquinate dehydratase [Facklamia miroungae]|uniref:3-dehydroquinate dehydratase n=1 Tax=Facklamia miroungae TaxID=120956 RepID=A0A1G7RV22_9LACT|nr:type II 3-dehydroquinate dehydratase [Facklamia miroungae]NKZ29265.1 type II 3-dehydroquinate dehydratase [Facklamia miroungae]SDG14596.1 3-dehydroquinate dehydratase [Facklamia miroungae]